MTNIVLCGGNGTRLWPISRSLMPKQFIKLFQGKSLFQKSIERNSKIADTLFLISNEEHYFLTLDQIEELGTYPKTKHLIEPVGRNTAPAIALACFELPKDEIVLVSPSDHLISDEVEYQKAISKGIEFAKQGYMVTFGIEPTEPHTGYGYIEANGFDVVTFHEKPDLETAKKYIEKGNYFWNSGIFLFQVGTYLEELEKFAPDIYSSSLQAWKNRRGEEPIRIGYQEMVAIPENSIDYAVMEKSQRVKVVPANIGWSDVGSFDSLFENVEMETRNIFEENSGGNYYYCDDRKKVIATIGLKNYIVVDTRDGLLISKKGESQEVKNIVKQIGEQNRNILNFHTTIHRPWGKYTVLEVGKGYKIKKIEVKPGKRLSLQKHYHRNEHWIVVSGTATVQVGEKSYLVRPNESTYIKMGEVHRLENNGKIPLILIEVQVGEYTEEDDIIRLQDDYQRER